MAFFIFQKQTKILIVVKKANKKYNSFIKRGCNYGEWGKTFFL